MSRGASLPIVSWISSREIDLFKIKWVRKDDVMKWAKLLKDGDVSSSSFEVLKILEEE